MSSRVFACCYLALGCSAEQLAPRAQTLLFIDTNAPLVGQLAANPELPEAIAVDTLRIDRLDAAGNALETRELVAPDTRDWPISFGVVASESERFRLRAFSGVNASASQAGPLAPLRNLALDRLIEVSPQAGLERLLVTLDAACFNAPASFSGHWTSCVDAERVASEPSVGLEPIARAPETHAGSSPWANATPCRGKAPSGSVCIPGGSSRLGDEAAALLTLAPDEHPTPSRAMHLAPFFLDRTELTVGRYRAALASGNLKAEAPSIQDATLRQLEMCTFLGESRADNDDLPLNCVSYQTARDVCQLAGGDLPSEAQWEYAARGRGQAQMFTWGSANPECCTASIERRALHGPKTECNETGIEPAGSHDGGACPSADVARDGVLDMAGSLTEWTLDSFRPYDHACWMARGLLLDPRCDDEAASAHTVRGSYFNASFLTGALVLRSQGAQGDTSGFRCAYPAGEP